MSAAESRGLSGSEKEQLERLQALDDKGLLEKERLEELAKFAREREGKLHRRAVLELSPEDQGNLERLELYFEDGVPGEMALREKESELEQLRQLRQEQSQLVTAASQRPQAKVNPGPMIGMLLLGAGAAAGGIVLLLPLALIAGVVGVLDACT